MLAAGVFGFDQDYTIAYRNRSFVFDIFAEFDRFVRNTEALILINDDDGIDDEPRTVRKFNINFITAGISQRLYPTHFFKGHHTLTLAYERRRVKTTIGIPTLLDATTGSVGTSFDQIVNNSIEWSWHYNYFRDRYDPRNDVNPRDGRAFRILAEHVWTDLFTADSSLTPPVDHYSFNRFLVTYREYLAIPKFRQHTLELGFIGGYIDRDVNSNDEFFAGGRLNFRAFGDISSNSTFFWLRRLYYQW